MNIVFGTDGWRARIADEYTFDAVRVCAQSVAEWVQRNGGADRGVVIGFDRRFASEHFAAAAAEVVAAHDVNVHLATAAAPTQSFSWATMRKKAKAGIVITASHNPSQYNGLKLFGGDGAVLSTGDRRAAAVSAQPGRGQLFGVSAEATRLGGEYARAADQQGDAGRQLGPHDRAHAVV